MRGDGEMARRFVLLPDYQCSHSGEISADRSPDQMRLSDQEGDSGLL
jgi:hypothetical protein